MKVFIAAFLAVAASASPVWYQPTVYTHGMTYGYPGYPLSNPLVHAPVSSYYQPLIKPVVPVVQKPVTYIKDDKIHVEKEEDKVKVYKTEEVKPIVYGHPFAQSILPVAEYKVDVPATYSAKNGEVEHTVYKREAEAEPTWPFTPYTTAGAYPYTPYTYGVHPYNAYGMHPYNTMPYMQHIAQPVVAPKVTYKKPEITSNAKVVANDAAKPYYYAAKDSYVADSEGALHIAKRDAESQFVNYNPFVGASPYTFSPYMAHYTKPVVPAMYHTAYPTMYNYGFPQMKVKSYSNDAVKPENYAGKHTYRAETDGSLHIAKREAEAEPLVYTNPLSLSTYAVGSAYQTPFVHRTIPYYNQASFYNRAIYNPSYYF